MKTFAKKILFVSGLSFIASCTSVSDIKNPNLPSSLRYYSQENVSRFDDNVLLNGYKYLPVDQHRIAIEANCSEFTYSVVFDIEKSDGPAFGVSLHTFSSSGSALVDEKRKNIERHIHDAMTVGPVALNCRSDGKGVLMTLPKWLPTDGFGMAFMTKSFEISAEDFEKRD